MVFYENGKKVRYNPYNMKKDTKIGEGDEVVVYKIGNEVYKFYKRYCRKIRLTKENCDYLTKIYTERILLPTGTLTDKKRNIKCYKMKYMENLGEDSFFSLKRKDLSNEMSLIHEDIITLSDHNVLIDDLLSSNIVYNNGIYFVDPGSFIIISGILDSNIMAYGINIDRMNNFLIHNILWKSCLNISNNYVNTKIMLNYIKNEIRDKNKTPLTYFIDKDGMEYETINELAQDKYNKYIKIKKK